MEKKLESRFLEAIEEEKCIIGGIFDFEEVDYIVNVEFIKLNRDEIHSLLSTPNTVIMMNPELWKVEIHIPNFKENIFKIYIDQPSLEELVRMHNDKDFISTIIQQIASRQEPFYNTLALFRKYYNLWKKEHEIDWNFD